jgi:hypothetical protein
MSGSSQKAQDERTKISEVKPYRDEFPVLDNTGITAQTA